MIASDLCLLLHNLKTQGQTPLANSHLVVDLKDVEDLIVELKERGYRFRSPTETPKRGEKTCLMTFDDGYFCNSLFDALAVKYQVPYVVFVCTYNLQTGMPFIWDLWQAMGRDNPNPRTNNYRQLYDSLLDNPDCQVIIERFKRHELHRPFTESELSQMLKSPYAHVGLHSHIHQPLVQLEKPERSDLKLNADILSKFQRSLVTHLALPSGISTPGVLRKLSKEYAKIYTIEGGEAQSKESIVHRISLVNPQMSGRLFDQIENSFSLKMKLRRSFPFLVNLKHRLLSTTTHYPNPPS